MKKNNCRQFDILNLYPECQCDVIYNDPAAVIIRKVVIFIYNDLEHHHPPHHYHHHHHHYSTITTYLVRFASFLMNGLIKLISRRLLAKFLSIKSAVKSQQFVKSAFILRGGEWSERDLPTEFGCTECLVFPRAPILVGILIGRDGR